MWGVKGYMCLRSFFVFLVRCVDSPFLSSGCIDVEIDAKACLCIMGIKGIKGIKGIRMDNGQLYGKVCGDTMGDAKECILRMVQVQNTVRAPAKFS